MIRRRVARVWGYLVAGSRSLADLKRGIRHRWQGFFDTDADIRSGLMPWEAALFDQFIPPHGDVLLVGSGSGRDLVALAVRGCHVTGIEPAGDALRLSQRALTDRGLTATLIEGFFEDAAVTGTFDAVMFSFHAYAYFPEATRRIAVLKKAAALLRPGGHLLVTHPANMTRPRMLFIHAGRVAGTLSRSDWRLEPGDLVAIGVEHAAAVNFVHAFENGEVEREADAAGLHAVFRTEFVDEEVVAVAISTRQPARSADPRQGTPPQAARVPA